MIFRQELGGTLVGCVSCCEKLVDLEGVSPWTRSETNARFQPNGQTGEPGHPLARWPQRTRRNLMLGPLKAFTFIFSFMVVGTILSEVSYKKKSLGEVIANWRPLLLKVIVGYVVLMISSLIYFKLARH